MNELNLNELTDDELIRLCVKRGDRDDRFFRELFRRYRTLIWRVCYGILRNSQDADDMTQEVFFKVYRSLPKFEGRSSLKTWIYRIAVNTCQNEIRRQSRRPQSASTSVEDMAEYLPGEGTPETYWLEQVRNRMLADALRQLRPEQQHVIRLKDFEQQSYEEIATSLGIGLSAAKMRVQRARLALQKAYRALESA